MRMRWLVGFAIALGIFLRVYHLDQKTFWGDEVMGVVRMLGYTETEIVQAGPRVREARDIQSYFHVGGAGPDATAGRPLAATVASLASEDPQHPPLYYLLARVWAGWAGTSVFAHRTLPMLFGILAIGAMAWLAFELSRSWQVAGFAAAIYAISPFAVLYSQEAREYAFWALATLISSTLLLRAERTGNRWEWAAYGLACVVCLYTYPLAAFVMVAHCAYVFANSDSLKRDVLVPYILSSACAVLLFLPWLLALVRSMAGLKAMQGVLGGRMSPIAIGWVFVRDVKTSLIDLGVQTGALRTVVIIAGFVVLALLFYGFVELIFRGVRRRERLFLLALFLVPAIPLLGHDLVSGGGLVGQVRYFQPVYLAVPLVLALMFSAKMDDAKNGASRVTWTSAFVFTLLIGIVSCLISSQATTWYNKAFERTPDVAAVINRAQDPIVLADKAVVGDRGTSRVLEIGFYLKPQVAMRVNLHCDACLTEPPPRIDVFRDAAQYRDVFVLGSFVREIPTGDYTIQRVGIEMDPHPSLPLDMFAGFPQ